MDDKAFILLLSLIAGGAGTTIGGIIGAIISKKGKVFMGRILAFAGGVMVGVVCFEMIPEAINMTEIGNLHWTRVVITFTGVLGGILSVYLLNKVLDVLENKRAIHSNLEDLHHEAAILEVEEGKTCDVQGHTCKAQATKKSMFRAGIVMLFAIALHNFPEGMAIGASGTASMSSGIIVAIVLAVHNIPEGMTIAAPLASGGVSKIKSIFLTALAGFVTVFGALLGILLGGISPVSTGVCMALAGGAMLYVTFGEIMPQIILMEEGRIPAISTLVGILFAMIIVYSF